MSPVSSRAGMKATFRESGRRTMTVSCRLTTRSSTFGRFSRRLVYVSSVVIRSLLYLDLGYCYGVKSGVKPTRPIGVCCAAALTLLVCPLLVAQDGGGPRAMFVAVDQDVKLEVLDWGGSGRPVVLLTGLGDTAHVYDEFAPKLATAYHVYGITRRGHGRSSAPAAGYSADRLGDDVLAVMDALKLERPVLLGHSIAGEELSSIGSRHPERVSGLIYLDAGYSYAYYDPAQEGAWGVDLADLHDKLERLLVEVGGNPGPLIQDLLKTTLPDFERDLRNIQKEFPASLAPSPATAARTLAPTALAILTGEQRYTQIRVPALALFAGNEEVAKGFEKGVPSARVIRLPGAPHYMFRSNEEDVLREVKRYIDSLP